MSLGLEDAFYTALRQGRQRSGLTTERVQQAMQKSGVGRAGWRLIQKHQFFQDIATSTDLSFADAFISYVKTVAQHLDDEDQMIVDAVLALDLDREHRQKSALEKRREDLYRKWKASRLGPNSDPEKIVSPAAFRLTNEESALKRLAAAMDNTDRTYLGEMGISESAQADILGGDAPLPKRRTQPKVVVLGAAVMDIISRVNSIPEPDGSSPASSLELRPGGKGLTQAVGAARLGFRSVLIAALGDDAFGHEILTYLKQEGVDTSLIKVVEGERTPITQVITPRGLKSAAIGWKNADHVGVHESDLKIDRYQKELNECDALLVSLEPPMETIEAAIRTVTKRKGSIVILTPAPPTEERAMHPEVTKRVDFIVMNTWELGKFNEREGGEDGSNDDVISAGAQTLLLAGVDHVFVTSEGQCHAFCQAGEDSLGNFDVPSWPTKTHESAGERDAFCAMLAFQVVNHGGRLTERAVFYATAAMAYAGGQLGVPDSMPTMEDVEDVIRRGSILLPDN